MRTAEGMMGTGTDTGGVAGGSGAVPLRFAPNAFRLSSGALAAASFAFCASLSLTTCSRSKPAKVFWLVMGCEEKKRYINLVKIYNFVVITNLTKTVYICTNSLYN